MISVLMSIYSGENHTFLEECLESLENQTLKANEVIIVQDGPISEKHLEVIAKFKNSLNIISPSLDKNMGLAHALNFGMNYCKHELVVRVDADDISHPDRFLRQYKFMMSNKNVAASSTNIYECDEKLNITSTRNLPLKGKALLKFAKTRSPLNHPSSILRKKIIQKVGGYPEFHKAQDYALWSKLLVEGYHIENLQEYLVKMRTGNSLFKKRGLTALRNELKVLFFQYSIGFINVLEFTRNVILRSSLRLSPNLIKKYLYKNYRN